MQRFSIFTLFILVLILIELKSSPNLKNSIEKNIFHEKVKLEKTPTTKYSKEYYDKLAENGIILDNLTSVNPHPPIYEKIDLKADKKRRLEFLKTLKNSKKRRLSGTQTLENLGFVDLYQDKDSTKLIYATRFLVNNIKKVETKFILYPYPFTYLDHGEEKNVENGGFFTLNETMLNRGNYKYFQKL